MVGLWQGGEGMGGEAGAQPCGVWTRKRRASLASLREPAGAAAHTQHSGGACESGARVCGRSGVRLPRGVCAVDPKAKLQRPRSKSSLAIAGSVETGRAELYSTHTTVVETACTCSGGPAAGCVCCGTTLHSAAAAPRKNKKKHSRFHSHTTHSALTANADAGGTVIHTRQEAIRCLRIVAGSRV